MTETELHRPDQWHWSYWPFLAGLSTPFFAWGFVAWPPLLLVAVTLAATALVGWMRDIARGDDASGAKTADDSPVTTHVVLAAALVLITALFYAAAIRALAAHDLLRPDTWPTAGQAKVTAGTITATIALVIAAPAAWASWRVPRRGVAFAGVAIVLVLVFFGALAVHVRELVAAGFVPSEGPAGSVYYWILGVQTFFTVAATAALAITASFRKDDAGPATGAALYFAWIVLAWLIVFALVHMHVVPVEGTPLQ